jgi:valine--pyruvate aminotransferase
MLSARYGWPLGAENVAITTGSQHSFFSLFNLFSGLFPDGEMRHVDLPLAPEYIGYGDLALMPDAVRSVRPTIEFLPDQQFKYRVDFARFRLARDTGAVCVSRPTNPTGNVLSAGELATLVELTAAHGVPLIVDNAYGPPFPDIVFGEAEPVFAEHVINCFSLSKLGLAGLRTGLVVANAQVIELLRSLNASMVLASNSLAASLITPLLENGTVMALTQNVVRPFYRARVDRALSWCRREFAGLDFFVHKPEGAIFLWLWFRGLPISSAELYARLKARGVLVIPGHFFFPGLPPGWAHTQECLRVSYAQAEHEVEAGIRAIGEEVRAASSGRA